jgi:hypothetical protein
MAHTNRIGIGETQTHFAGHLMMVFDYDIAFTTHVLPRHAHLVPHAALQSFFQGLIDHIITIF